MEIGWILKVGTTLAGALVGIIATIFAGLTLLQKRKAHRIELAEKLYLALKSESKLLAMEVFSQLFGLRYKYTDIKILAKDNDALQKLTMLKRRRDAVKFSNGQYNYNSSHEGTARNITLLAYKLILWSSFVGIILSLVFLFIASLNGKIMLIFIVLLGCATLGFIFAANELSWYREADKILKLERQRQVETNST